MKNAYKKNNSESIVKKKKMMWYFIKIKKFFRNFNYFSNKIFGTYPWT